jgi:hypothetical protein
MITRRVLLRSMAAVAAAASASVALAERLTSPFRSSKRLAAAPAATDPAGALKGRIYFRGEGRYEAYRQAGVWNARKPNRFPEAIVMAQDEQDVIAAVRLAKQRGWQVGTRSGGHSWVGSHTRDNAILINLARMQQIEVDPATRIAKVSPAVQGQGFNKVLREQHGLMFPSGHCYGIGLGGFIMCGGHGWNSRLWGPGCANLVGLDLVNADGELIHADERQNSDYLWAARGGGPGFFGAAVRYYVKTYPRPPAHKFSAYVFPVEVADELLSWLGEVQNSFPKYMECSALGTHVDGQRVIRFGGRAMAYTEAEADAALDMLESCPVVNRAISKRLKVPTSFPPDTESPNELNPTGARYVCDGVWTNATAKQILPLAGRFFSNTPTEKSFMLWMCWGPVQKLPDMAYSLQGDTYLSPTSISYEPADDARCAAWAADCVQSLQPISLGGQMNDDNMAVNRMPYLSPDAERRLEAMRAKYDPQRRFAGFLRA